MVYDWEDKQTTCYNMYVVEKKSLDEVMKFFKDEVGFVPSKRAFQTQFRRWGFPSKQNPTYKNEALVARTRELWQANTSQKDMIGTLLAEGFTVTERELMRLRSKHHLLLRGRNILKQVDVGAPFPSLQVSEGSPDLTAGHHTSITNDPIGDTNVLQSSDHGQSLKRKERLEELRKESDGRWESKKRRRRTRDRAGLPADPPGAPRFPSETTLESTKASLGLDNTLYMEMRATFKGICQEHSIVRKTTAGPEQWEAVKMQLIQTYPHLTRAFEQAQQPESDQMRLSLDLICQDVTKRMRIMETNMTLAEAKNTLMVNPEEGRRLRQSLIELLAAHNFINKVESTNWEEIKQLWMARTGLDSRIPPIGSSDRERCMRAVQIVCRDIMKRWRDAQVSLAKSQKPAVPTQGEPVVVQPLPVLPQGAYEESSGNAASTSPQMAALPQMAAEDDYHFQMQIDPSLLE